MKALRILGYSIIGLLVISGIAFLAAAWAYRDIPAEVMETRYASEASRFMNIDGVRFHYRDEGNREGPGVLLLHANFSNLIGWDPWVDALKDRYRVVRLDFSSHGLTGPDPSGDYTQKRTLELLERFVDAVGLKNFTIGGASLGGTMAIQYTHNHPDRIDNLILLNPGSLEGRDRKESGRRGEIPDAAYILTTILPRALPAFMLRSGFGDDSKLTDTVIDRWHDMWLREGNREAQLKRLDQYRAGDIEGVIGELTPPTLLMWGEANETAHFEQAAEFQHLLKNIESLKFISYPGVGHMAVQEAGVETGRDVRVFLDERHGLAADAASG